MTIMLTHKGFTRLLDELAVLKTVDRPRVTQRIEEVRPIGVVEDDPEYMQALEAQDMIDKKILEMTNILKDCQVFEKTMCQDDKVTFGSTVEIEDCDTHVLKRFTIVSVWESDVNEGRLSCEAPIVRQMIGLNTGDIFEFNNREWEITHISYNPVIFQ